MPPSAQCPPIEDPQGWHSNRLSRFTNRIHAQRETTRRHIFSSFIFLLFFPSITVPSSTLQKVGLGLLFVAPPPVLQKAPHWFFFFLDFPDERVSRRPDLPALASLLGGLAVILMEPHESRAKSDSLSVTGTFRICL